MFALYSTCNHLVKDDFEMTMLRRSPQLQFGMNLSLYPDLITYSTSQMKFYAVTSGNHLRWGTEVKQIQIEGQGEFGSESTGAGFQALVPTNVSFF